MSLNTTNAVDTGGASVWNSTAPTFSVFSVGTSTWINPSGGDMIAYCFADVEGFSKAGSYTGNGSSDGTFVYTGFRPAWLMIKRSSNVGDWFIFDAERNPYNVCNLYLEANASNSEGTYTPSFDLLSNGFKVRDSLASFNSSGDTFIYLAFAEHPFKYSNAR